MPSLKVCIVVVCFFLGSVLTGLSMQITVEYKDQEYPVVGVRNSKPVILVDGKRRVLQRYTINYKYRSKAFKDGYLDVRNIQATSTGLTDADAVATYNAGFRWVAEIKTSFDTKDAFVAFHIKTQDRKEGIILMDLPEFKANKWRDVSLDVDTISNLGIGTYKTYFYNKGELLLDQADYDALQRADKVATEPEGEITEYPKILNHFVPHFPEELIGVIEKGTVRLEFTIDAFDRGTDIKVLKTDHDGLNEAAIEVIKKTEFAPAKKGFIPVSFRLRQNIEIKAPKDKE